jgi:hypothetical protein
MEEIIKLLKEISYEGEAPKVLTECGPDEVEYGEKRQIFNLKFQLKPTAIVLCRYTEHVQQVVKIANDLDYTIRVRSGGHDHEGECSGTDTILIDLSEMTDVKVDKEAGVARIQPGNIFQDLIPKLAKEDVCVPHGTCGTVGIAGFTMGGGWGPWTRLHGMCCDSLVGATIVLGSGEAVVLTADSEQKELLWALRGGGGMSYGIVTEFVIKTFPLPETTIKFNAVWQYSPAFTVLKHWEDWITPDKNQQLIGTNLMIMAIPTPKGSVSIREAVHSCTFFGYFAGSKEELYQHMKIWFADLLPTSVTIIPPGIANGKTQPHTFGSWDRLTSSSHLLGRNRPLLSAKNLFKLSDLDNPELLHAEYIPPDVDDPAPHKITSRMTAEYGWNDEGRESLISSLQSDLLFDEGEQGGLLCYTTLGAISGAYYANYKDPGFPTGSAFPYKKRKYTIQYQAWWDQGEKDIKKGKEHNVHLYTNRAEDWIEECRKRDFPETDGSFISFKDAAVPTRNYFLQSYDQLKKIKEDFSNDPKNRLSTRKTII